MAQKPEKSTKGRIEKTMQMYKKQWIYLSGLRGFGVCF
jgi:hypothetical protein